MAYSSVGQLAPLSDSGFSPSEEGFSVADIIALWQLPQGTVYWLANKHRWRRYKVSGRAYYHPQDVLDALD